MKFCRFFLQTAFAVTLPFAAFSFDSARWLAKREAMGADAVRLRQEYSNAVQRVNSPSEDLVIPLETYPDGTVRISIFAKRAQFLDNSKLVWAEDMKVTKFEPDGKEKSRIEASRCIIDRFAKSGWVEGHAKIVQDKSVFEGDGVYFSSSNNFVTVFAKSDLRSEDLKFGGLK